MTQFDTVLIASANGEPGAVALLDFFVLNLLGLVNPVDRQIEDVLAQQLDTTASQILHDADDAAAWGLSLSEEISAIVGDALQTNRIAFEDLRNDALVCSAAATSLPGKTTSTFTAYGDWRRSPKPFRRQSSSWTDMRNMF